MTTNLIAEPGKNEIIITRVFNAAPNLVFQIMTTPKHIPHWWGPKRYTTVVDKMEVEAGGMWRFVQRDAQGNEFGFHGVYHEVTAPNRVINTFEFEGMPGHVILETATLEALTDGRSKLTVSSIFQSVADRDGMISSGMEQGTRESHDRLAELLTTL